MPPEGFVTAVLYTLAILAAIGYFAFNIWLTVQFLGAVLGGPPQTSRIDVLGSALIYFLFGALVVFGNFLFQACRGIGARKAKR